MQNRLDRKSTRLNSSHGYISYAVFCLKKTNTTRSSPQTWPPPARAHVAAPARRAAPRPHTCAPPARLELGPVDRCGPHVFFLNLGRPPEFPPLPPPPVFQL